MENINQFKDKKIYHISHIDLDGLGARLIGEYYIKPVAQQYTILNTNFDSEELVEFSYRVANNSDYILFTDIHPPNLEKYKQLDTNKVMIFDHHETGYDMFNGIDNYYYDPSRCGAKIFYDYLTEGCRKKLVIDQFIELVNTYDMWKTNSELWKDAVSLHFVLWGYVNWSLRGFQTETESYENFVRAQKRKFEKADYFFFLKSEQVKIKRAWDKVEEQYKKAKRTLEIRTDNEGNTYIFSKVDSKVSLVAFRLFEEYRNKIDYLILYSNYNYEEKGTHSLSLRSEGNFSVRRIAEPHGGGGHLNASGLEFSKEQDDFVQDFLLGKKHLI